MENNILKDYICLTPFKYLEFFEKYVYPCCPGYIDHFNVGDVENLGEVWNGERIKKIQDSILNGTYSYCNKDICPSLSYLYYNHKVSGDFIKKGDFNKNDYNDGPKILNLSIDRTCNLSCPSCRIHLISENSNELLKKNKIIEDIAFFFGSTATRLHMLGTGDVFASKACRDFLINFDDKKFPNLYVISIQTNGMLLNKNMWNKIIKSQDLIKMISVSIDASTKETYEKIRRGGNWDILMDNLIFLSKLNINVEVNFVVQDTNYKEMEPAYKLITTLSSEFRIKYVKIINWGTYSNEEFKVKEIYNESHPDFHLFLNELRKVAFKPKVFSNMNDIIEKYLK